MSVVSDIVDLLQANGVGTPGVDLFERRVPDSPARLVAVLAYPGLAPEYHMGRPTPAYERPRVQVRCRAESDGEADALAKLVYLTLGAAQNIDIGGVRYLGIIPLHDPFALPDDASGNSQTACDYQIIKEVSL
jgi:hypothetical protein